MSKKNREQMTSYSNPEEMTDDCGCVVKNNGETGAQPNMENNEMNSYSNGCGCEPKKEGGCKGKGC